MDRLRRLSTDARQLLWLMGQAPGPVDEQLLRASWPGATLDGLAAQLAEQGLVERDAGGDWLVRPQVRARTDAWMREHPDQQLDAEALAGAGERCLERYRARLLAREPGERRRAPAACQVGTLCLALGGATGRLQEQVKAALDAARSEAEGDQIVDAVASALAGLEDAVRRGMARQAAATGVEDAGRLERAIALYESAVVDAGQAHRADLLAAVQHNLGHALRQAGRLDEARDSFLASAASAGRAELPALMAVGAELEALRIQVMQGHADEAAERVEERLQTLRGWWRGARQGKQIAEAPDADALGQLLGVALDIARNVAWAQQRWERCAAVAREAAQLTEMLGGSPVRLAVDQHNLALALVQQGQLAEATLLLEGAVEAFRRQDHAPRESGALIELGDLMARMKRFDRALELHREAATSMQRHASPAELGQVHDLLASNLMRAGAAEEGLRHRVAALVHALAVGHEPLARGVQHNLQRDLGRLGPVLLPALADLFADEHFSGLGRCLSARGVSPAAMQAMLDTVTSALRRAPESPY